MRVSTYVRLRSAPPWPRPPPPFGAWGCAVSRPRPPSASAPSPSTCLGLGLLSLLGPSTPTYDPWSWIIWGREVLHLELDTQYGPSWKPLPVLFTTPFAIVPDASPDLWVAVARAGGLAAVAMAYRVAARLGGGVAGGVIAATSLALSTDFLRFAWVGDSEGLLVAFLLAGVELHLAGRERAAIWAGFAAALLRPESWPFVGLYALWVAWRDPRARKLVFGLCVARLRALVRSGAVGLGEPAARRRARAQPQPERAGLRRPPRPRGRQALVHHDARSRPSSASR